MTRNPPSMTSPQDRPTCYSCMRPMTSCMCCYTAPIDTETHFIILMHPMEFKKEKNGTGRLTHLQLKNSQIIMGVDFSEDKKVNALINHPLNDCYILYPGKHSINLSTKEKPLHLNKHKKSRCVFIIDATWPCAKKMLKLSSNLHKVQTISFDNNKKSEFIIKQQPSELCLSTIESTRVLLELFVSHGYENCTLDNFTFPFKKMVEYQVECIENPDNNSYRSSQVKKVTQKTNYKPVTARNMFFGENLLKVKKDLS